MKILFASARLPFPLDTGAKIRTFHLLSAAAAEHEVVLVAPASTGERHAVTSLRERLPDVMFDIVDVPAPNRSIGSLALAACRNVFDPLPLTWMRYQWPALRRRLMEHGCSHACDLLHCDHVQIAPLALNTMIPCRVINVHNIESGLIQSVARTMRRPEMRLAFAWQAAKVVRAERRIYPQFDRAVTCSAIDGERLQALAPDTPVTVVPNGVDHRYFAPRAVPEEPATLVFTGSMDWAPNLDAVRYFVREILPRVRSLWPQLRFVVVGRNAPTDAVPSRTPGVKITGTVPDVRPLIASATAVVVPLRAGGGTRLKILEAWAMRKAVVSTSLGAEGLRVSDGNNILLADSPSDFAARIDRLLGDAALRARIADGGYQTAQSRYDWSRIGERLLTAYDEAIAGTGSRTQSRS
ncbi:MAG TPA: glycosyltransferase [Candidatus Acidoferrum sp.]|nr:glycosyltransferase [Candidatus Acidoferrum sp.]